MLALAFLTAGAANAGAQLTYSVILDDYLTTQHVDTGSSNPSSDTLSNDSALFGGVGADRTLQLETFISGANQGSAGQSLDVDLFESGRLSLATSASIVSESLISYSNIGDGLGFDLTTGGSDRFLFDIVSTDQSSDWTVSVTDTDGDTATYDFTQGAVNAPLALNAAFVDFTDAGATTDFDRITDVSFILTATALDFEIERFGIGSIPEPSSALLMFTALPFLLRRKR